MTPKTDREAGSVREQLETILEDVVVEGNDDWRGVPKGIERIEALIDTIAAERSRVVLDMIAEDQGWEETRDHYAKKLGIPAKYAKELARLQPEKGKE